MEALSNTDKQRLYIIRSYGNNFQTGHMAGGRQVLMGPLHPGLTAAFFDRSGNLLDICEKGIAQTDASTPGDLLPPPSQQTVAQALAEWQDELGFEPSLIRVREFHQGGVGITERPFHYARFIRDPVAEEPDEQERTSMHQLVQRWDRENRFVLSWGKEYWMCADGTVHSS